MRELQQADLCCSSFVFYVCGERAEGAFTDFEILSVDFPQKSA